MTLKTRMVSVFFAKNCFPATMQENSGSSANKDLKKITFVISVLMDKQNLRKNFTLLMNTKFFHNVFLDINSISVKISTSMFVFTFTHKTENLSLPKTTASNPIYIREYFLINPYTLRWEFISVNVTFLTVVEFSVRKCYLQYFHPLRLQNIISQDFALYRFPSCEISLKCDFAHRKRFFLFLPDLSISIYISGIQSQ